MPVNGAARSSSQGHRGYERVLGYTPVVENDVITGYNIFDRGGPLATLRTNLRIPPMENDRYREMVMEAIYQFGRSIGVYQ